MANERYDDDRDDMRRFADRERYRGEENREGAFWRRGGGRYGREPEPRAFSQDRREPGYDDDYARGYGDDRDRDYGRDRDRFRHPGRYVIAREPASPDTDFTSPYGGASGRGAYGEYGPVRSGPAESAFGLHNPMLEHQAEGHYEHGPHRGKGPKNYTRSDARIHEDVSDRLADDSHLDASRIEVTVVSGEVTLAGHVDDRRAKRRAEDCADYVSGVTHVQNNLRCGPGGV